MPRTIWKGAIRFGLVHVPVGLVSATSDSGIDFDWLDKRSMDPVGSQRINKRTGKPIAPEQSSARRQGRRRALRGAGRRRDQGGVATHGADHRDCAR